MTAHTPGPWRIERRIGAAGAMYGHCVSANHYSRPGVSDGRDVICDCRGPHGDANARLVAAAPDLLAALRDMVRYDDLKPEDQQPAVERARAAIARAVGEGVTDDLEAL